MPMGYWLSLLSIPLISAVIGWYTNRLAIQMTFYPLEFKGLKPYLGWQGIIPAKSLTMAEKVVDIMANKLLRIEDEFAKIDPAIAAREMKTDLEILCRSMIDEVMEQEAGTVWRNIPAAVKDGIYQRAAHEMPAAVEEMMHDITRQSATLVDIHGLVRDELTKDKDVLNQLFLKCGGPEFKFIERSGFYFGFALGLVQMLLWYFYPVWWLLPLFGVLNGYLTNWVALKLIFEPQHPMRIGPFTVQGLFLKRQNEVAEEYARFMATRVITAEKVFDKMLRGSASVKFTGLITAYVNKAIDTAAGFSKNLITLVGGQKKYAQLKADSCRRFIAILPVSVTGVLVYADKVLHLEQSIAAKLKQMPPNEFIGLLRPVFQEDEWKLIAVGAVLGGVAGVLQTAVMLL